MEQRVSTPLIKRERQIAGLIALGMESKDMARVFGRSIKTVENHRYNINKKLGTKNAAQVAAYAINYRESDP